MSLSLHYYYELFLLVTYSIFYLFHLFPRFMVRISLVFLVNSLSLIPKLSFYDIKSNKPSTSAFSGHFLCSN
jgi:hypothetical protein